MKVREAIKRAGGRQADLMRLIAPVTRAAISIWTRNPGKELPELYEYRLRRQRPEWFKGQQ